MKLIQLTDLHLMPPGERLCGLDPAANLAAAIADINRHHGDAALCVLTGDLTNAGDAAAYAVLRERLAALRVPWQLIPGNHDDRANLLRAFPDTPRDDAGFVQSRMDVGGGERDRVRLLLLDTLEPGEAWGTYCARRVAWLEAELAAAGDRPLYLFLHHPPFSIGIPSLDRMPLRDAGPLAAALERHRAAHPQALRHLFCGHVHRPLAGSWRGIPFSAIRGTNHQVAFDLVTEAPVPKALEAPAYGVIFLDDEHTVVHLHEFPLGEAKQARAG